MISARKQQKENERLCLITAQGKEKQENPGQRQGFQEPKTKIYETFYLQPRKRLQVFMIRTAAKIMFFPKMQVFFDKNEHFFEKILDKNGFSA